MDDIRPGAYFPFGMGPRVCIGQTFALTEMLLIVATILQQCNVTLTNPTLDPGMFVQMSLRPKHPVMLKVSPRTP